MMLGIKKHSRFGIASCLTAMLVWAYFVIVFALVFYTDGFAKWLGDSLLPSSSGRIADMSGVAGAVVLFAVMFVVIPICGHALGLLLGIVGVFRASAKRHFAVIGILLNILPVALLFILWAIGSLVPATP